ncbi:MAG: MFS transporter [Paracoccaceae bacterium]
MPLLSTALLCRAQIVALAAIGVMIGSFAALVPGYKAAIGATDPQMGLALMCLPIGSILAQYLASHAGSRLGRPHLPVAGAVMAGASLLPLAAGAPLGFAAAMFGLGVAVSFFDMSANMRIAVLENRHGRHLQNLCHAMFAFAYAAGAFGTTLARTSGLGAAEVMPWVAGVLLVMALLSDEGRGWTPGPDRRDHPTARLPWPIVLTVAAILFLTFVCQSANDAWSALHIERTLGAAAGQGGYGPVMFGLALGIGRVFGQVLTARLGDVRLIRWASALAALGLAVIALAPVREVAVAGVGLFGLGVSVLVPTVNTIMGRLVPPALAGTAISRVWMIAQGGVILAPNLMGQVSGFFDLRVAFLVVAVFMLTVVPLSFRVERLGRQS